MKSKNYINLAMILGLSEITLQSGLFGNKNFAKFDEENLDALEKALANKDAEDLQAQIKQLEQEKASLEAQVSELSAQGEQLDQIQNAIEQALEVNEIEASESFAESIEALGAKCKEYGASKNRHTFSNSDGKDGDPSGDGLIGGIVDPRDEIYQTLKNI